MTFFFGNKTFPAVLFLFAHIEKTSASAWNDGESIVRGAAGNCCVYFSSTVEIIRPRAHFQPFDWDKNP
jgi:hypothetical protein